MMDTDKTNNEVTSSAKRSGVYREVLKNITLINMINTDNKQTN